MPMVEQSSSSLFWLDGFLLAYPCIILFRYMRRILVKDEMASLLTYRIGHDLDKIEIACSFDVQHSHHRAMYAVNREVFHTPGDVMGLFHPGQACFVTAFLYYSLTGAARLHSNTEFFVILLDDYGLQMSSHSS